LVWNWVKLVIYRCFLCEESENDCGEDLVKEIFVWEETWIDSGHDPRGIFAWDWEKLGTQQYYA
jgi:hypothetical protein